MKFIITLVTVMGLITVPALAFSGQDTMGPSLLLLLFFGFGALIVVCQFIPSLVLFCSMMKGLFSKAVKNPMPMTDEKKETV
jgi:hypothetical protein